jgi:peroxin-2
MHRFHTILDFVLGIRLVPSHRRMQRDVSYEFMNRQMVWQAFTVCHVTVLLLQILIHPQEFLLFIFPFISIQGTRRRVNRAIKKALDTEPSKRLRRVLGISGKSGTNDSVRRIGKYWLLPLDQCAICAQSASMGLDPAQIDNATTTLIDMYQPRQRAMVPESQTEGSEDVPPQFPIYNPYVASCGHMYCYHCVADQLLQSADDASGEVGWECLRCIETVTSADRFVPELPELGNDLSTSDYEFSSDFGDGTETNVNDHASIMMWWIHLNTRKGLYMVIAR